MLYMIFQSGWELVLMQRIVISFKAILEKLNLTWLFSFGTLYSVYMYKKFCKTIHCILRKHLRCCVMFWLWKFVWIYQLFLVILHQKNFLLLLHMSILSTFQYIWEFFLKRIITYSNKAILLKYKLITWERKL